LNKLSFSYLLSQEVYYYLLLLWINDYITKVWHHTIYSWNKGCIFALEIPLQSIPIYNLYSLAGEHNNMKFNAKFTFLPFCGKTEKH